MKRLICIAASATAFLLTAPATAAVIDFDVLPDGTTLPAGAETLISDQYASLGVTFTGIYADGSVSAPVATNYAGGPEGPNYQRNYLGNAETGAPFVTTPTFELTPRFEILRLDFATGADDISFSHNNFALVTTTTFNAYDEAGNLLESFTVNSGNGWQVREIDSDGVYRLDMLASPGGIDFSFFGIDNLTFTAGEVVSPAVPEPASWAMMIAGFGLVGAATRRQRRLALA